MQREVVHPHCRGDSVPSTSDNVDDILVQGSDGRTGRICLRGKGVGAGGLVVDHGGRIQLTPRGVPNAPSTNALVSVSTVVTSVAHWTDTST